jgi:peptidyl-tRNA hydrolase
MVSINDIFPAQDLIIKEEFEDTKGVIRFRKSNKKRQHNGQRKKDKRTNNDLQNIHIKLKID